MRFSKNILFILFCVCSWSSMAQDGNNPFELMHRAEKKAKISGLSDVVEEPEINIANENPFNIIRTPQKNVPTAEIVKKEVVQKQPVGKVDDENFRFSITIAMLVLLALLTSVYRNQLIRAYRAFSNENVMRMLHREKGTVSYIPYYILYSLFIFNAGIFIYLLLRHYDLLNHISNFTLLSFAIGGVGGIMFLKHTILQLIGSIFPISKETSFYNMTITIFGIVVSVVLFIFNLLIAYTPQSITPYFIYFSLFLIGVIYLFRSIRGLSIASKFLNRNKFHFFIYLCTVEIAPILILWKLATGGIGIQ